MRYARFIGVPKRISTLTIAAVFLASTLATAITPLLMDHFVHAASGTVKNVNTDESFSTIQAAIDDDDTIDGHKIRVFDGTYEENVSIDKNIVLESKNGPGSTTIAPASGRAVELKGQLANMSDVKIRGFSLTSGSTNAIILQANSQASDGYDYTNLEYRNLVIDANGGFGLGLFDVDGIKIRNVSITNADYGIEAIGVKDMDVKNSSVSESNRGLNVNTVSGYEANTNLRVQNNTFTNNGQATTINGADDVRYMNNTITGGYLGLTLQDVTNAKAKNNNFSNLDGGSSNHATGVFLNDGTDNVNVANNSFNNISASGKSVQAVLVGDSASSTAHGKVVVTNNTIDGIDGNPGAFGVMVNYETTDLRITKNTFENISSGNWMAGVGLDAPTPGAKVVSNNFSNFSAGNDAEVAVNVNLREGNTADPAAMTVKKNNFYLPSDQVGANYDVGTESPVGTLFAKKNYWNDQQGPSGPNGETGSSGALAGNGIDYSPWLCSPAPSSKTTTDGDCEEYNGTVSYTNNYNGTGVLEFNVEDGDSNPVTGLVAADFTVASNTGNNFSFTHPRFNVTNNGDGTYTVLYSPHEHVDSLWDISINGHLFKQNLNVVVTNDDTAPDAPTITSPGARTWHNTTPITNDWTAVSDDSGIDYYQIAYNYDDGHSFGGSTCPSVTMTGYDGFIGCRDVNGTSRNHTPANWEQGGVTIWVRAVDNAGNVGPWSNPVHYYYDHGSPETDITVSGFEHAPDRLTDHEFTVSGTAEDNQSLNRVYVQLVNRDNNQRYGGTTIHLIGEGTDANWSKTYDANTMGLPEGDYAAHVAVVDMAGNKGTAGWTDDFTVDSTGPAASDIVLNSQAVSPSDVRSANCESIVDFYTVGGKIDLSAVINDTLGNVDSASYKVRKVSSNGCTLSSIFSSSAINMANTSGNTWEDSPGFDTTTIPDGEYTIRIQTTDNAGNMTTKFVDVLVDNTEEVLGETDTGGSGGGSESGGGGDGGFTPTFQTFAGNVSGGTGNNQNNQNNENGEETDGEVKADATNNGGDENAGEQEKEVITESSSTFGWYWILLILALAVAGYYAYRNWRLNKD